MLFFKSKNIYLLELKIPIELRWVIESLISRLSVCISTYVIQFSLAKFPVNSERAVT